MVKQLIVLMALAAVAKAVVIPAPAYPGIPGLTALHGHIPYAAPAVAKIAAPVIPALARLAVPAVAKVAVPEPYDPNPQYSFSYDVQDGVTGDVKSQQETRSGDVVHGAYSLIEPDGTRRLVEYTADPVQGFNAIVHREPVAVKAVAPVAKVLAPAIAAPLIAPAITKLPAIPAYAALHG